MLALNRSQRSFCLVGLVLPAGLAPWQARAQSSPPPFAADPPGKISAHRYFCLELPQWCQTLKCRKDSFAIEPQQQCLKKVTNLQGGNHHFLSLHLCKSEPEPDVQIGLLFQRRPALLLQCQLLRSPAITASTFSPLLLRQEVSGYTAAAWISVPCALSPDSGTWSWS